MKVIQKLFSLKLSKKPRTKIYLRTKISLIGSAGSMSMV